jgi:hypothetical protein
MHTNSLKPVTHLAVWSGPRNISTAMMRSFGNRPSTKVVDEPFYAHYLLKRPRVAHPGRDEVIASQERDPRRVADELIAPLPTGVKLYYQKHMCQHMIEGVPTDWLDGVAHVFLIRDPRDVVRSWAKVVNEMTLDEIGLPKQVELFRQAWSTTGRVPAVIDSDDVLADPGGVLRKLCERLGIAFDERMLRWEPGPRDYDGVWGKYWYDNVNNSTGFARRTAKSEAVDGRFNVLIAEARVLYDELARHRIR